MSEFDADQARQLVAFGVVPEMWARFAAGEQLLVNLDTQGDPGIAVVQQMIERLRCGIFAIRDPGGGLVTLARFRAKAVNLARAFHYREIELFGAAIINAKLEEMLLRQGFVASIASCPEALGNETWDILAKTFLI